jgi:rare lipoprotein A (peptidoglycan hydrolase)
MFHTPTRARVADMGWNPICLALRQITGGCGWMPAYLARTGLAVFALLFGITLLTEHVAAGRVLVASTAALDLPQRREVVGSRREIAIAAVAVAGSETAPATITSQTLAAVVVSLPAPVVGPGIQAAPPIAVAPTQSDGVVIASWYGPGFYGNRTACGQTYTPEILGVAHLTLPCGTSLTLTHRGRSISVPVIDRGPYIAGRTLDLSNATKLALGCTDLCTVRMQILR